VSCSSTSSGGAVQQQRRACNTGDTCTPPPPPPRPSCRCLPRRCQDELRWRSAHVVGFSMGGMISTRLAVLAPERVRSLTLISVTAGEGQPCSPRPAVPPRGAAAGSRDPSFWVLARGCAPSKGIAGPA